MAYRTIVFDLDGTLVDSAPDIQAATNEMLDAAGLAPVDLETLTGFIGNGIPTLVSRALAHRGLDPADHDAAPHLARFRTAYDRHLTGTARPYPGVSELLDALQAAAVPCAICTNKPERPARDLLAALGWGDRFRAVVGGDTLPVRKPDPAPLAHAIQAIGGEPASTLYVGDSGVDHATARAAGVPFAFFSGGYQRGPIPGFAPAHVVDRMDGLLDVLRSGGVSR